MVPLSQLYWGRGDHRGQLPFIRQLLFLNVRLQNC
jgi:hypothetical protein